MERIGIFGGSFDPPHIGHMQAAKQAAEALGLDRLLMIPAGAPPHKSGCFVSGEHRLAMLRIACGDDPVLQPSDLEIRRQGISYTYETVAEVARLYPNTEIVLFMGTDMFLCFDKWKYPDLILQNASLAVFYRGDPKEEQQVQEKKAYFEAQGAKIYLVENPITQISSSDLRRMLVFGCASPFLDAGVAEYIQRGGLYGATKCYRDLSLEELEQVVVSLLKPNRVAHVLGCRQTAAEMANIHGADPVDAQRAALLHDITKAIDGPLQLTLCREYGINLDDFSASNPKTLHALTGSLVAQRIFGENPAVVAAIASHTTGKADMNMLEKIIYVADYMEPNRDFPGVEQLRQLAYTDLTAALKLGLEMTLRLLKEQGREISPESRQALEYLSKKE